MLSRIFSPNYSFSLRVTDPAKAIKDAQSKVILNGGNMTGDINEGQFSGEGVEGTYMRIYDGFGFQVTITKKPMFVSYQYVEQQIRGFFGAE